MFRTIECYTPTRVPIPTLPETEPFVELRRAARRRDDTIKAFRGFALGAVLGASSWAVLWFGVHALVAWAISQ